MTINASFQSFSVSAMRLSFADRATTASATPDATPAPATTSSGTDRVTLSTAAESEPAAEEPAAPAEAPAPEAPAPEAPAPEATPATTSPLFTRLDADADGTMTKEEFTSGALALLGRRGDHPRVHGNGDGENGRRARGVPGLERRLEKAFDRVDANKDGGIDEGELDAALSRAGGDGDDGAGEVVPPPPPPEQPQSGGTLSFVSVTYVSVAVQRYTSLQQAAPAAPATETPEAPAA
jgi:hypothetical protein